MQVALGSLGSHQRAVTSLGQPSALGMLVGRFLSPATPQESPGPSSPAVQPARPSTPGLLPSPGFQHGCICSSPRLLYNEKADFTPTKSNPKEMRSQSLSNPTGCVYLLAQQRVSQKEEMVWRLLLSSFPPPPPPRRTKCKLNADMKEQQGRSFALKESLAAAKQFPQMLSCRRGSALLQGTGLCA